MPGVLLGCVIWSSGRADESLQAPARTCETADSQARRAGTPTANTAATHLRTSNHHYHLPLELPQVYIVLLSLLIWHGGTGTMAVCGMLPQLALAGYVVFAVKDLLVGVHIQRAQRGDDDA